jgi:hypothetical protein
VGDLDGDGHADLIAAISGSGNVAVFRGNGDGTFQAAQTFAAGPSPVAIVVADFDGDGRPDVTTTNDGPPASGDPGHAVLLLGNGDGTLQAARRFAIGDSPWAMVTADFDADGRVDVATANIESNNVSVLLNAGSGSFHPLVAFGAGNTAWALAAGDFNGDGRPDLAVVNHGPPGSRELSILLNDTPPPVVEHPLTVMKDGNGSGVVISTSDPGAADQIDCGYTCEATYAAGTVVTLTAHAAAGSVLTGWSGCDAVSGDTCTVTMTEAKAVVARFDLRRFTLDVSKAGIGRGTVTSTSDPPAPSQIQCGSVCSATYNWTTSVTLRATPALGSLFLGWSGCDAVSGRTCTVTMTSNRAVTATFIGIRLPSPVKF